MAKQTINIGASPNDGTGTPLRTAFDYTNQNFTELYTATGPSGNNIVVPGSATITGDLTVDTSTLKVDSTNNRVGINTASPATDLHIFKSSATDNALIQLQNGTASSYIGTRGTTYGAVDAGDTYIFNSSGNDIVLMADNAAGAIKFAAGGNTESMRLNANGLGVGASPAQKLTVAGSAEITGGVVGQGALIGRDGSSGGATYSSNTGNTNVNAPASGSIRFNVNNGTFAGVFDSNANLGIGVTPSAWGSGYTALQNRQTSWFSTSARDLNLGANVYVDAVGYKYIATAAASSYVQYQGAHSWYNAPSGTAGNAITFTQAMTLDASGILFVGNTAAANVGTSGGVLNAPNSGNSYTLIGHTSGSASGSPYCYFFYNSSSIGSITQNGTTGVLYNINSDYRLKESVAPLSGGLARVNALKPSIYKWKSDGSNGEGFLAHELAEVVPAAVTGEKDAVNEDGSIKSQGIDMSRIVPILVAAIQELTARVQTLEAK